MLLDIVFHDSWNTSDPLYVREEFLFFGIMVVVHRFTPALAICQEVFDRV